MAFSHGSSAKLYVNGYDLTAYFKGGKWSGKVAAAKTTCWGNTAEAYIPGLMDATFQADGFWDGATGAVDAALNAALAASASILCFLPAGDTLGSSGYGLQAVTTSYDIDSPVENANALSLQAQSKVGREAIKALAAKAAVTATGNGTAVDNAAATSNGGAAYIQNFVTSDLASIQVKVQHSVDNSVWADLASFTLITPSSNTAERVAVAAGTTVRRYLRASYTINTPGASPTSTIFVGFARA